MIKIITAVGKILFYFKKKTIDLDNFDPEKILFIKLGSIGDVLMTTPLVKAIKDKYPDAQIDYLVGQYSKDVLKNNPSINNVIPFDEQIFHKFRLGSILALAKETKQNDYDLGFVLDKSWALALFAFLSGADVRVGFDRKGEGFANNLNIPFDASKYEVEYYNELASLLGIPVSDLQMKIFPSQEDEDFATEFFITNRKKKYVIGMSPGGAKNPGQDMDVKRPAKPKYAKICNLLSERCNIIFFGSEHDTDIAEDIIRMVKEKPFNLTGRTNIMQTAALIKRCNLFITHDTGLMHIAAAVRVPIIALFGPTQPIRFAPKGAKIVKPASSCSKNPCYDIYGKFNRRCKCIGSIDPEQVAEIAEEMLKL